MTTQIEPDCLKALMDKEAVKIIDGSWALDGTDMHALYQGEHIPGAQFFDIEAISDKTSALPHMAPSPAQFAEAVGRMGISETDHVVVYDRLGLFSAARVWWTFKLMGHDKVQVLRGGLPGWITAGMSVTASMSEPAPAIFTPAPVTEKIISLKGLKAVLEGKSALILDARPKARFDGTVAEPRAGLRSGHMPGSHSLPFGELIESGALKPRKALDAVLDAYNVDQAHPIITTCGSGVTAAIISMALHETGHTGNRLYDGAWAEWGQEGLDTEVVRSPS
jgi:thiosulfate/3-mercaptopyruvate sulfurtransferase